MDIMEFMTDLRLELEGLYLERMKEEFSDRVRIETSSIARIEARYKAMKEDVDRMDFMSNQLTPIYALARQYTHAVGQDDGRDLPRHDFQFHHAINKLGENQHPFTTTYLRKLSFVSNTHSLDIAKQHEAIATGLRECDFKQAREAMVNHLNSVQQETRFWGEYFLRLLQLAGKYRLDDRVDLRLDDGSLLNERDIQQVGAGTLLLGTSGLGKSTFLMAQLVRLTWMERIPVFIDLRMPMFQDSGDTTT